MILVNVPNWYKADTNNLTFINKINWIAQYMQTPIDAVSKYPIW